MLTLLYQYETIWLKWAGWEERPPQQLERRKSEDSAAKRAVEARWDAYYREHPEKRKTARTAASRNKISKKAKK
jgi:hypothetical protein